MKLKDTKTKIFPSRRRGGKELPSSSALDSPSVMRTPPHAINSNMSQVIDDATSAMDNAYDDVSTLIDDDLPPGEFLDEQLAIARVIENAETDELLKLTKTMKLKIMKHLLDLALLDWKCLRYLKDIDRDFLACNDRYDLKKLLCKLKEISLNARMKYDPAFATSPILYYR